MKRFVTGHLQSLALHSRTNKRLLDKMPIFASITNFHFLTTRIVSPSQSHCRLFKHWIVLRVKSLKLSSLARNLSFLKLSLSAKETAFADQVTFQARYLPFDCLFLHNKINYFFSAKIWSKNWLRLLRSSFGRVY